MSKPIILVDTYQLRIAKTGIRKHLEELVAIISESENSKFQYKFFPDLNYEVTNAYLSKWGRFKQHFNYFIYKQINLPLAIKKSKADVVIIPDYYAPYWANSAHKLVFFHDTFFWDSPEHYGTLWWAYFRRAIMLGLKRHASVLTVSSFSQEKLTSVLPKEITTEVLYNSARNQTIGDDKVFDKLQLNRGGYFLHVGVFERRKNLKTLIKAFNSYKQQKGNDKKLVLVGSAAVGKNSNDLPSIRSLIAELKLQNSVILAGYLNDEEISSLLDHAHAYVFPSKNEGFGYPILEAFAHDCPVIISDQPALMEVGANAVLVFNQNSVDELVKRMNEIDDLDKNKLIQKGRERLKDFDRKKYLPRLESIISSKLAND